MPSAVLLTWRKRQSIQDELERALIFYLQRGYLVDFETVFQGRLVRSGAIAGAIFLTLFCATVYAGDFDGTRPLQGVTEKIIKISRHRILDNVNPDTVGLPKKFIIDFSTRSLRPSADSIIRKVVSFRSLKHIENMIVMQGVDTGVEGVNDGLAWSLTISKDNGRAILSASGDGLAYAVFGQCAPYNGN